MFYSVALVIYSRGTVPDVRADLTLPPEVEFLSAQPAPTLAPPVGGNGLVHWDLGDLTGPRNSPLEVRVRPRSGLPFGTTFTAALHVENGKGDVFDETRLSRLGRTSRARFAREQRESFGARIGGPRRLRLGRPLRYKISAESRLREGFSTVVVRAMVPASLTLGLIYPAPAVMDAPPGEERLVEWHFFNPGKKVNIKMYASADPQLQPGEVIETFVSILTEDGEQSLVISTTTVR